MPPPELWISLTWALTGAALCPVVDHLWTMRPREPTLPVTVDRTAVAIPALATFVLFGLLAWRLDGGVELVAFSLLALVGVRLAVIDLAERRLPTSLVMPLYPTMWGLLGLAATIDERPGDLLRASIGMIALPAAYLTVAILSGDGLGAGDVRLAGPIGLTLAWQSWGSVVTGTVLALTYACLTIVVMLATGRATRHTPVPFGPPMLGGAFTAALAH